MFQSGQGQACRVSIRVSVIQRNQISMHTKLETALYEFGISYK